MKKTFKSGLGFVAALGLAAFVGTGCDQSAEPLAQCKKESEGLKSAADASAKKVVDLQKQVTDLNTKLNAANQPVAPVAPAKDDAKNVKADATKAEVKADAKNAKAEVKADAKNAKAEVKADAKKAEVKVEAKKAEVKAEKPAAK